jgi:ATP-dependent Lon protease
MEKGSMNLRGSDQVEQNSINVISLFGNLDQDILQNDPMSELLEEAMILDTEEETVELELTPRKVVNENQFPDQSMYILEEQLSNLKTSLNRMRFYLGDLEDMIPR